MSRCVATDRRAIEKGDQTLVIDWTTYFKVEHEFEQAARDAGLSPPQARALARRLAPRHKTTRRPPMCDTTERALEMSAWLTERGLPATQQNIDDAFRACEEAAELRTAELRTAENNDAKSYAPPDPYAYELKTLRTAATSRLSVYESKFRALRLAALQETRAALDSETPESPMSAAELSKFPPPNPYAAGIKALRDKKTR